MTKHVIVEIWRGYRKYVLTASVLLFLVGILNGLTIVSVLPLFEILQTGVAGDSPIARFIVSLLSVVDARVSMLSLLILVAIMTLLKAVCFVAQESLFRMVRIRMEIDRRNEMFGSLMKTDIAYLYQRNFGRITNVVVHETRRVALLVDYLSRFAIAAVNATVYLLAVFAVDWKLTVLTALMTGIVYAVIRGVFKKARTIGYTIAGLNGNMQELIHTALFGYRNVKTYVAEKALGGRLGKVMRKWKKLSIQLVVTESILKSFFEPLVVIVAITVFVVYKVEMAIFVTFVAALLRMNKEVREVQKTHYKIARNVGSLQMYEETLTDLRSRPYPDEEVGVVFDRLEEGIRFEQVSYKYKTSAGAFQLGPVDVVIPRSRMVALVGPSGSGKSTLIDLVAALLLPDAGRITVDGADLRDYNLMSYRRKVGYVTQDIFLLNESVLSNIRFTDESISEEDARKAAETAYAADFIEELPAGYDTMLGEHGARLSGGQKQRISLARALARRPEILILDEATSALDSESERRIQQAVEKLAGSVTIIAIAHRLSTVRNADYLYVFDEGKIAEQGTYDELLAQGGKLFRMHTLVDQGGEGSP